MSTIQPSPRGFSGITVVLAFTLLAPVAVTAQDEVADLAPVAAPSVDDTSADAARVAARALAAQHALLGGDIGSLQEDALFGIVAGSTTLGFARVAPATVAQEATPAAGALVPELLGHGLPAAAPGFDLSLYRVTFGPGAAVPPHTHPGASVVYVESGTLAITPLEGEIRLVRAGTAATPEDEGELLAHGAEVLLEAGDALFSPGEHGDSATNAGDGPLVLLLANLHSEGEPLLTLMATPAP